MLNSNLRAVFSMIPEDSYVTSEKISTELKISPRTVRVRLKELSDVLKKYDMYIESKPRHGYTLVVKSKEKHDEFLKEASTAGIPETMEERTHFLLLYLVNHEDYIKLDDLCDFLYVSKPTLSNSIKQVEVVLNRYDIQIERKPNHGIRAVGSEFDIRRCIVDNIMNNKIFESLSEPKKDKDFNNLAGIIMDWMQKYQIRLSEVAFENLVEHIYIMIRRVKKSRIVNDIQNEELLATDKEKEYVYALGKDIEQQENIKLPEIEYMYLALHIAGKRTVGIENRERANFVIREKID